MDVRSLAAACRFERGAYLASGELNLWLGYVLLVVGFGVGGWLDPWSLGEREAERLYATGRMHARHGQAVVLAAAFFQLGLGVILAEARTRSPIAGWGAVLSVGGSGLYAIGWTLGIISPAALWLAPGGATVNLLALMLLSFGVGQRQVGKLSLAVLAVFALGMTMNLAMALFAADPHRFLPAYLGDIDGVRLRMLRLARAAVIALPVLALLLRRFGNRTRNDRGMIVWGERFLIAGAVGMPLLLVLAATVDLRAKLLLGIPANLVLAGVVIGLIVAVRERAWAAAVGWCLIAFSMTAGMLMGMYAFDGPFAVPPIIGQYNSFARRLTRLAHSYWIVQGMTAIFIEMGAASWRYDLRRPRCGWLSVVLLLLGIAATSATVLLASSVPQAVRFLGVGASLRQRPSSVDSEV